MASVKLFIIKVHHYKILNKLVFSNVYLPLHSRKCTYIKIEFNLKNFEIFLDKICVPIIKLLQL